MVTTTSSEKPLATAVDTYAPDWAWTADVGAAQRTDDELTKRITFIESGAIPDSLTPHETVAFKKDMEAYYLRTNDRLLMHLSHDKGKPWRDLEAMIVVPNQLKSIVMRTYHESAMAGHLGFIKTLRRIKDKYFCTSRDIPVQKYLSWMRRNVLINPKCPISRPEYMCPLLYRIYRQHRPSS